MLCDPDTVNNYFANIAFKDDYDQTELDCFHRECNSDDYVFDHITNIEVERLLRTKKPSSAGCDDIPSWLLHSCSYKLSDIAAHILNCSFKSGKVISYWLNALVTPVPKVSKPAKITGYRPISVTPL